MPPFMCCLSNSALCVWAKCITREASQRCSCRVHVMVGPPLGLEHEPNYIHLLGFPAFTTIFLKARDSNNTNIFTLKGIVGR